MVTDFFRFDYRDKMMRHSLEAEIYFTCPLKAKCKRFRLIDVYTSICRVTYFCVGTCICFASCFITGNVFFFKMELCKRGLSKIGFRFVTMQVLGSDMLGFSIVFFNCTSSHHCSTSLHCVPLSRQSWTLALPRLLAERLWRKRPPSTLSSFLLRRRSEFWRSTRRRWKGLKG